jgi:hypothetical protein
VGWVGKELGYDSSQGNDIFLFSIAYRSALMPIAFSAFTSMSVSTISFLQSFQLRMDEICLNFPFSLITHVSEMILEILSTSLLQLLYFSLIMKYFPLLKFQCNVLNIWLPN